MSSSDTSEPIDPIETNDPIKVIGIDIGLTHLSICLLEKRFKDRPTDIADVQTVRILRWEEINMIEEFCIFCNAKATSIYPHRKAKTYFSCCNKHAFSAKGSNPFKKGTLGFHQLCIRIKRTIVSFLSKHNKIDRVRIELQPPNNKYMIRISHVVFAYLVDYTNDIQLVHAKQKLLGYIGPSEVPRLVETYNQRKSLAKQDVAWYLTHVDANVPLKVSADMADSFLYALYA